jgi:aryl-alcohol dehydrogenase-like predicted oxidoreductase
LDSFKKPISKIGLGCVTFGREIDQINSFKLMDHASACGITFFDTAAAYGAGNSESLIGTWLTKNRQLSDMITVATKISPPFEPNRIKKSVEESLKRLRTDKIDLLYLHRWDPSFEMYNVLEVLEELISSGKVEMIGACNFKAEQIRNALHIQKKQGLSPFRFVQNNHNLAVSHVDDDLRIICDNNDISLITYSPLGAGFLTGKHQNRVQTGTRFDLVPEHQKVYFNEQAYNRLEHLLSVARRTGYAPIHLALGWALHQPGVSSVLIGGRTEAHLDQALAALHFNNADIFAELENPVK